MTPAQCRMARAALRWTLKDLADKSKVSHVTISRYETGLAVSIPSTVATLHRELRMGGVEFIDQNGMGPGVRIRARDK